MTEIDRFPVSELPNRYEVKRTALYDRLKALGIEPVKEGTRSYVSGEQLWELDQLDNHLKRGGIVSEYVRRTSGEHIQQPTQSADIVPAATTDFIELVREIAQAVRPTSERGPLANWEDLERAADLGWLLSTSQVQELVGCKPKLKAGEVSWREGSFVFTKIPRLENGKPVLKDGKPLYQTMRGGQLAWRVSKIIFHLPTSFDSAE